MDKYQMISAQRIGLIDSQAFNGWSRKFFKF